MIYILKPQEKLTFTEVEKLCLDRSVIHVPPIYREAAEMIVKQMIAKHLAIYGVTSEKSEEERSLATHKMIEEGKYMIRFFVNSTLEDNEFIITTTNKPNPKKDGKKENNE